MIAISCFLCGFKGIYADNILEKDSYEYSYTALKTGNSFELKSSNQLELLISDAKEIFNKNKDEEKLKFYNKAIEKIEYNSDNEIDINSVETLKSFLYLKKFVKYNGDMKKIKKTYFKKGQHNEQSEILGANNKYYEELEQRFHYNKEYNTFCDIIYNANERFKIIPIEDKDKAEIIANKLLCQDLEKYNTSPNEALDNIENFRSVTHISDIDNEWNDWTTHVLISADTLSTNEKYVPYGIIALHELGHIKQTKPGEAENKKSDLCELVPTIDLIVLSDEVYKEIHNIPIEEEIHKDIKINFNGNKIGIGSLANKFRSIKKKYGLSCFDEVLLQPEAHEYIKGIINKKASYKKTNNMKVGF